MAYRNVHQYWVYIMSNKSRSAVYTGITNDLYRRYLEHRTGIFKGFTQRYNCCDLIYYEEFKLVEEAIEREKEIKGWRRTKKERLIDTLIPIGRIWPRNLVGTMSNERYYFLVPLSS